MAQDHPGFAVLPFTASNLLKASLVLVGSLTGIDWNREPTGKETGEAQRIWTVLCELDSGKIVAKGTALAEPAGIDVPPSRAFADSPAWTDDRFVRAHLATCAGTVGDPMDPVYLDGLLAAALVVEATAAYEAQDYERALDYFEQAERTPAGDQLRIHNGLYMTNWGLGRHAEADEAFEGLVDDGFRARHLSVKFLFRPGSATFLTSATGPAALNDRLSRLRADYIRERLEDAKPELSSRLIAHGAGSSENIVGTGRDDQTDALDRRVEMAPFDC